CSHAASGPRTTAIPMRRHTHTSKTHSETRVPTRHIAEKRRVKEAVIGTRVNVTRWGTYAAQLQLTGWATGRTSVISNVRRAGRRPATGKHAGRCRGCRAHRL